MVLTSLTVYGCVKFIIDKSKVLPYYDCIKIIIIEDNYKCRV